MIQLIHHKRRFIGRRLLAGFVFLWMFAAAAPCAIAGLCDTPDTQSVTRCHHDGHAAHMNGDCGQPTSPDCRNADQTLSLDSKPVSTAGHYMPVVLHTLPVVQQLPNGYRVIQRARLRVDIPHIPLNLLHANLLI